MEPCQSQMGPFQRTPYCHEELHKETASWNSALSATGWSSRLRWAGLWGEVASPTRPRLQLRRLCSPVQSGDNILWTKQWELSCPDSVSGEWRYFAFSQIQLRAVFFRLLPNCCPLLIQSNKQLPASSPEVAAVLEWVEWHSDAAVVFF